MNFRIRIARLTDAPEIAAIYGEIVRDTPISMEEVPPTTEEIAGRMREVMTRYPWLVAESDGKVIGYVYAGAHRPRAAYRWCAEVTAYIAKEARGQGVGKALYSHLFDLLRQQNVRTLLAGISLPNEASVGLHESMGMRPCARFPRVGYKFNQWWDVGYWSLDLAGDEGEPAPFVPFPDLTALLNMGTTRTEGS